MVSRKIPRKGPFSDVQLGAIKDTIQSVARNYFEKNALYLTGDEFLEAFIQPDHLDILRKVVAICGSVGGDNRFHLKRQMGPGITRSFTVNFPKKCPIPIPDYVEAGNIVFTCRAELRERILGYMAERVENGDIVGDFIDCVSILNANVGMDDMRALGVLLPALPSVVSRTGHHSIKDVSRYVERLSTGTKFSLPFIPPEVRERMQRANSLMLALMMYTGDRPTSTDIYIERSTWYDEGSRKCLFDPMRQSWKEVKWTGTSV